MTVTILCLTLKRHFMSGRKLCPVQTRISHSKISVAITDESEYLTVFMCPMLFLHEDSVEKQ